MMTDDRDYDALAAKLTEVEAERDRLQDQYQKRERFLDALIKAANSMGADLRTAEAALVTARNDALLRPVARP